MASDLKIYLLAFRSDQPRLGYNFPEYPDLSGPHSVSTLPQSVLWLYDYIRVTSGLTILGITEAKV